MTRYTSDRDFFNWIYDRLIYHYHENPNIDYMISFKERIEELFGDKKYEI